MCYEITVIDTTTTVADQDTRFILNIYPNPSDGSFEIDLKLTQSQQVEFGIYNILGKTIKLFSDEINSSRKYKIDLDNYSDGIYIIKVATETEIFTKLLYLLKK